MQINEKIFFKFVTYINHKKTPTTATKIYYIKINLYNVININRDLEV